MPGPDLLQRWAGAAYWRPEEGIALAFGLDPTEVREAQLDHDSRLALSVKMLISRFTEHARRAVEAGDLPARPRPFLFVKWADRVGLRFHQSWSTAIGEATGKPNRPRATATETSTPEVTQEARAETMAAEQKPLHTRTRENMLKLIIGMAVEGYGYNPGANRSTSPRKIQDDLAKLGNDLTDDTIRTYLSEGASFLSEQVLEQKFGRK